MVSFSYFSVRSLAYYSTNFIVVRNILNLHQHAVFAEIKFALCFLRLFLDIREIIIASFVKL